VKLIFTRAVAARASDVHIDPTPRNIRIRFRIDGSMVDQGTLPIFHLENILTRLKVLGGLDIASKPIPQDGHCEMEMDVLEKKLEQAAGAAPAEAPSDAPIDATAEPPQKKQMLDIRISIFPTTNGEAAVCRILNRNDTALSLDSLGMDAATLEKVRSLIRRPYGMMLITGPTGSGKTTSLYSIIRETMGNDRSIVTLEDPVEFRIDEIRQVQITPERGMTFPVGMKSILRQDPDIIMIGEIRDPETAEYAVRASLVGRNVFSTIHSNTTIGTIARLIDMNIERSLIAYALNGVISTRLVKKVCSGCKTFYMPSEEYLAYFGFEAKENTYLHGTGCGLCNNTGFAGRTGIFEVLEFDNRIRAMIIERKSMEELEAYALSAGMKTLKADAADRVLAGVTTIESVAHAV
jgi:type IV pilus assembly protein PilB